MKSNVPITLKFLMLLTVILTAAYVAITFKDYVRENPSPLAKKINETLEKVRKENGKNNQD